MRYSLPGGMTYSRKDRSFSCTTPAHQDGRSRKVCSTLIWKITKLRFGTISLSQLQRALRRVPQSSTSASSPRASAAGALNLMSIFFRELIEQMVVGTLSECRHGKYCLYCLQGYSLSPDRPHPGQRCLSHVPLSC